MLINMPKSPMMIYEPINQTIYSYKSNEEKREKYNSVEVNCLYCLSMIIYMFSPANLYTCPSTLLGFSNKYLSFFHTFILPLIADLFFYFNCRYFNCGPWNLPKSKCKFVQYLLVLTSHSYFFIDGLLFI